MNKQSKGLLVIKRVLAYILCVYLTVMSIPMESLAASVSGGDAYNAAAGLSGEEMAETGNTEIGNAETGDAETGNADTGNADTGNAETGNTEIGNADTGNADTGISGGDADSVPDSANQTVEADPSSAIPPAGTVAFQYDTDTGLYEASHTSSSGITVALTYAPGVFPEYAVLEAKEITAPAVLAKIDQAVALQEEEENNPLIGNKETLRTVSFEVKILAPTLNSSAGAAGEEINGSNNADVSGGNQALPDPSTLWEWVEVQPDTTVGNPQVTFTGRAIEEAIQDTQTTLEVVHVANSEEEIVQAEAAELTPQTISSEVSADDSESQVTFEAEHFSVLAVVLRIGSGADHVWDGGTQGPQTLTDCTIEVKGTVTLTGTLTISGTVKFIGDGIIQRASSFTSANMISVSGGADLILDGITLDGNNVSVSSKYAVSVTGNGSSVTMESGKIINCENSSNDGSAVNLSASSGQSTFTMNDGTISNNKASSYGGAIYAGGAGDTGSGGHFIMNGGTISGNQVTSTSSTYGGSAIYVRGFFTMTGGTITGNTTAINGGAVYSASHAITSIEGGTISDNISTYRNYSGYDRDVFYSSRTEGRNGNLLLSGEANVGYMLISLASRSLYANITSPLQNPITLSFDGTVGNNTVVAQGTDTYNLTIADMQKISTGRTGGNTYYLKLDFENNQIKLSDVEIPYSSYLPVEIYIENNGSSWSDHGKTLSLKTNDGTLIDTTTSSTALVELMAPEGTYNLFDGASDTGVDVTVTAEGTNAVNLELGSGGGSPDTSEPSLTAGSVERTSVTNGAVTFSSNELGTYAWGTAENSLTHTGNALRIGSQTIQLTDLSDQAQQAIYIQGTDGAGNASDILSMTIPGWVTEPPTIGTLTVAGQVVDTPMNLTAPTVNLNYGTDQSHGWQICETNSSTASDWFSYTPGTMESDLNGVWIRYYVENEKGLSYSNGVQIILGNTLTLHGGSGTVNKSGFTSIGEGNYTLTLSSGADYTLPTSVEVTPPVGYYFAGWYDNENLTGNATTVILAGTGGSPEYWAKWELYETKYQTAEDTWAYGTFAQAVSGIMAGGQIVLHKNVTATSDITINKSITLLTDGVVESATLNMGSHNLQVLDGTLTINDADLTITGSDSTHGTVIIRIGSESTAKIVLQAGNVYNTGNSTGAKAAIYTDIAGSIVTIDGGTVQSTNGSGVYIGNGAVNVTDGTISSVAGTGINVTDGSLTMNGGSVSATADVGIYVTGGTVTISDGTIESDTDIGIYLTDGAVTISGGTIDSDTDAGIYITDGDLSVTGGEIIGNTYAIYSNEDSNSGNTLTLAGAPKLTGTTGDIYFVNAYRTLEISDALTGAEIYTVAAASYEVGAPFSTTYTTNYANKFEALNSYWNISYSSDEDSDNYQKLIWQKLVTITPDSAQSKIYTATDPTYTYKAYALGAEVTPSSVGITGALGRATGENVTAYAYTLGTLATPEGYYMVMSPSAPTFAIIKKGIAIPTIDDKTYNGSSQGYGMSDETAYTFSAVGTDAEAATNVGTYTITATLTDTDNYKWSDGSITAKSIEWKILPKAITVKPVNASKKVGEANPDFTLALATGSSLAGTDTLAYAAGTPAFACLDVANNPVNANSATGTYDITITSLTGVSSNYAVTYTGIASTGTLTVTQDTLGSEDNTITPAGYTVGEWSDSAITVSPAGPYQMIRSVEANGDRGNWVTSLTVQDVSASLTFECKTTTGNDAGAISAPQTLSLKSDTISPISTTPVETVNTSTGVTTVTLTLSDDDARGLLSGIDVSSVTLTQGSTDCTTLISASKEAGLSDNKLTITFTRDNTADYTLTYSDNVGNESTITIAMAAAEYTVSYAAGLSGEGGIPTGTTPTTMTGWQYRQITLPANPYTLDCWYFTGWITTVGGVEQIYQPGDTFTMPSDDVTFTAVWELCEAKYETATNVWSYGTLAQALTGVMDGGRICLQKDVTTTGEVTVTKSMTLQTDGPARTLNLGTGYLSVTGGTLTIDDTRLTITGSNATYTVTTGANDVKVLLQAGTIQNTDTGAALYQSDSYTGTQLEITGGTVIGGTNGITHSNGTLTISGGTVTGDTYAIDNNNKTVNLSGSPTLSGGTADIYLNGADAQLAFPAALTGTETYSVAASSYSAASFSTAYSSDYFSRFESADPRWHIGYSVNEDSQAHRKLIWQNIVTIMPKSDQSKIYGQSDPVFSYNTYLRGTKIDSSLLGVSGALGRAAGENGGTYAYTLGTLAPATETYYFVLDTASPLFTIGKKTVEIPVIADKPYNGDFLTGLVDGEGYHVTAETVDTLSAKEVGSYTLTVELTNTTNYQWADGTSVSKQINWEIIPVYNLTFTPGTGEEGELPTAMNPPTQVMCEGQQMTLPANSYTLPDYLFCGWKYNGKLYAAGETFTMPGTDVELSAVWVPNQVADISGEVMYQNGKPVTHAAINIYQDGQLIQQTDINGSGKFKFKKLKNDAYDLEVVIPDTKAGDQTQTYRIITRDGKIISGGTGLTVSKLTVSQPQEVFEFSRDVNDILVDWDAQELKQCWEGGDTVAIEEMKAEIMAANDDILALSDEYDNQLSQVQIYQLFDAVKEKWGQLLTILGNITLNVENKSALANVGDRDALVGLLLTKEDLEAQILRQEDIQIIFRIEDVDQSDQNIEIQKSIALLTLHGGQNQKISKFFEVTIQKQVGNNPAISITETPKDVELVFWLPVDMRNGTDYRILRNHWDPVSGEYSITQLPTRRIGDFLYASSDRFSTYAIGYVPDPEEDDDPVEELVILNEPVHIPSPKTSERPPVTANAWMAAPVAIRSISRRRLCAPAPRRKQKPLENFART